MTATDTTTNTAEYDERLREDALHVVDSFAFIENMSSDKRRRAVGIWFEEVTGKPSQGWGGHSEGARSGEWFDTVIECSNADEKESIVNRAGSKHKAAKDCYRADLVDRVAELNDD